MATSRVMLTGATGFVGRSVCESLAGAGRQVRAVVRKPGRLEGAVSGCVETAVGEIGPETKWDDALAGVVAELPNDYQLIEFPPGAPEAPKSES